MTRTLLKAISQITSPLIPNEAFLAGIDAEDTDAQLTPLALSLNQVKAREIELLNRPETVLGQYVIAQLLANADIPAATMPWRLIYPPLADEIYLALSAQVYGSGKLRLPAMDVYVILNAKERLGSLSRSSVWSGITDSIATAKYFLPSLMPPVMISGGVQPCFRKEAAKDIQPGWKEIGFTQANLEISALINEAVTKQSVDIAITIEMLRFAKISGIPQSMIQLRMNNPSILYEVLQAIPFSEVAQFGWRTVNEMAASVVEGDTSTFEYYSQQAHQWIDHWQSKNLITPDTDKFLRQLVIEGTYDEHYLKRCFPTAYEAIKALIGIVASINEQYPAVATILDPRSVRGGIPRYNGTTMQLDVINTPNRINYPEVGGGGACEDAAKLSWEIQFKETAPDNFYQVGFGIGLLRMHTVLNSIKAQHAILQPTEKLTEL